MFNASTQAKQATAQRIKAGRAAQTADLQRRLTARIGIAVAEGNQEAADFWTEMLVESINTKGDLREVK